MRKKSQTKLTPESVRAIAREEALKVIVEHLKYANPPPVVEMKPATELITREFRNANPVQMEIDVNRWIKKSGALEVVHIHQDKDPLNTGGVIKTVTVRAPKLVVTEINEPDEDADTGDE